ncbi:MAG: tyrosine-type recombinase/integrase, partial [candidate division NC10 bacterium]
YLGIYAAQKVSLREFAKKYLEYARANKRPSSALRDDTSLKALLPFPLDPEGKTLLGDCALAAITPEILERYKIARLADVKPATVTHELATLRHLYTKAIEWRYVSRNPVKAVTPLKPPPARVRYLTPEERKALLAACEARLRPLVLLLLHTGLRRGELLALTWADIDLRQRWLTVRDSKTHRARRVPLNDTGLGVLQALPRPDDSQAKAFGEWTRDALTMAFRRAAKRAGVKDFRLHDCRHDAASQLAMRNVSLRTIQELLGHADPRMSAKYAHLSPAALADAVKLLDGAEKESAGYSVATRRRKR